VIAITVLAFSLRTKTSAVPTVKLAKSFTVVIDAAHGKQANGIYSGAAEGNIHEDEIVLSIAQKIKELNANDNIKIVFTRPTEQTTDLHKRVDIAKEYNADLFISVHANATSGSQDS